MTPAPETFFFKKSRFVTYLPMHYRYTRSHFWAERREENRLRVGFSKFATHLLGEIVDYNFETPPQTPVRPGQILGWVEGFKAISDIICIGQGLFVAANPALEEDTELISRVPYTEGWLYQMDGRLDEQSLDVAGYVHHLNITIEQILQKQRADNLPHTSESDTL
jgi:glycine cleavage system H protein